MLTELRRTMHEQMRISTKRDYKTPPNKSHTAEKYRNRTENTTEGLNSRLDAAEKSMNLKTRQWNSSNQSSKKERMKEWRQLKGFMGQHQTYQYLHYRGPRRSNKGMENFYKERMTEELVP